VTERPTSPATQRAQAFVEAHRAGALALGRRLADLIDRPVEFVDAAARGLADLADSEYAAGELAIAPGIEHVLGVRSPLLQAVERGLRPALRRARAAEALWIAEALARRPEFEVRLLVHPFLRRSLEDDPERTWQLIRRIGADAREWITVDSLAHDVALGILLEPYRWAELEQLVYSPNRWERRLVGSTIATIPFEVVPDDRRGLASAPALGLVESLIGDDEPDVQKALSWALRSWTRVDPAGVRLLLEQESRRAAEEDDGARAWVVRDTLSAVDPDTADRLRRSLMGIRRRASAANTSRSYAAALGFRYAISINAPAGRG